MSKTSSIVEVNGNRYDAITGQLVSKVKQASAATARPSARKMVDGFVLLTKQTPASPKPGSSTPQRGKVSAGGLHAGHQKTKTLMRQAVKKPAPAKAEAGSQSPVKQTVVNHKRESWAKTVTKHADVNRFGFLNSSRSPGNQATLPQAIKPGLKTKPAMQSQSPLPRPSSLIASVSHQKLESLLDEALVKATAHKQIMNQGHPSKTLRLMHLPKKLSISIAVVVLTITAAILIWQNLPSVAVHVAAARAHIKASLPGYTPSGYSFANPIQYENGSLTMKYINRNHAGDSFSLTQKTSNWDSSSLVANALPKDVSVQTSQVNGTTVYIYGAANDAAWVNHGIMYNLQNKSDLSSEQVMKIVQSL